MRVQCTGQWFVDAGDKGEEARPPEQRSRHPWERRPLWGARDNGCHTGKETVERRCDRVLRATTGACGRVWRSGAAAV